MAKLKESSERIKAKKATEVIPKKIFGDNSPSTPPDEILHTSSRPYKGGKPDKDSWFGNRDWYNEYVNILDDGTPVHEFGDNISSIKPPKNTRTLDIDFVKPENLSKEATEFMSSVAKKVQPEIDARAARENMANGFAAFDAVLERRAFERHLFHGLGNG